MEASNLLAAVSERFRSAPSYKLEFAGIFKISKWLETARLLPSSRLFSREAHRPRLLMLEIE